MKSSCKPYAAGIDGVALFTRAWIEMAFPQLLLLFYHVALFTRAWIEINNAFFILIILCVALFTRAWIEIKTQANRKKIPTCRPLYEGVD